MFLLIDDFDSLYITFEKVGQSGFCKPVLLFSRKNEEQAELIGTVSKCVQIKRLYGPYHRLWRVIKENR